MIVAHYRDMIQRAHVRTAASGLLDDRARTLGRQFGGGTLARSEAAAKILSIAVDSGLVQQMCWRHHHRLANVWGSDEVFSAVTSMLVRYALGDVEGDGHLDPVRFADGAASAAGWVGKVVGTMRTTRVLREMAVEARELAVPSVLEHSSVASAEEAVLAAAVPIVDDSTRGLPASSATIRIVHASALQQLLGEPPLRPWDLTQEQTVDLRKSSLRRPEVLRSVLAGEDGGVEPSTRESIELLWAGWSRDDVAAMLAVSTPERDVPRVLASAALSALPRPSARSRDLDRLRARAREGVLAPAAGAVSAAFEAFLDTRVESHSDFDRIRRRPTDAETVRRRASRADFPVLLLEAARLAGIRDRDLLSGLIALFIDPLPVADSVYFTPTAWRFRV